MRTNDTSQVTIARRCFSCKHTVPSAEATCSRCGERFCWICFEDKHGMCIQCHDDNITDVDNERFEAVVE